MSINNPVYFDAAYAGALGGMFASQTTKSVAPSTYTQLIACANAFAIEFDAVSAIYESEVVVDANLLRELCHAWWEDRNPNNLGATGLVPATYEGICLAITVVWLLGITKLQ